MKKVFLALGMAFSLVGAFWAQDALAADCFNCAKDSSGACAGANQCRGSRDECRKAGCEITGTASCSTSANVKICLSYFDADLEPIMTPADPAEHICAWNDCAI